jgi:hypothetical protein
MVQIRLVEVEGERGVHLLVQMDLTDDGRVVGLK